MALLRPGLPRRASARSSSRSVSRPGRRSSASSAQRPAAGRPVGMVPVVLLGTAGLLSVGALAGAGTSPTPETQERASRVVSADLAAHTPAAPTPEAAVPAGAATPSPALELGTDSLAVPTGAAAGVAPTASAPATTVPAPTASAPASVPAPAAARVSRPGAARATAPAGSGVTPSVRALDPVDPVEAWRDPGESMERTSLTFLAMAAALGLFVLWLRRQHHT
ncbi:MULTISPECIES: hypothetical protein [Arsenicicoccus]|uniref:hypothetical protein n=1 Tax=Arsenicicoccus TaxID=267408 RepID=UPI0012EC0035|nr:MULTISPECIES: hypothetical protein [Arsenicicoccus]